jgi:tetratricopeptide (TPR) repeat protein
MARPALHHLVDHEETEHGDAGALAYLHGLEATLGGTEAGEEIAYQIALCLLRQGQKQAARDAFLAQATRWPYPNGLLCDDALYRASEIDEELGLYDRAIADLRKLVSTRESSWISGSYERPRYDAAQLRIGELYASRLHDDAKARRELHTLYSDFTTSILRDKALWKEAELAERDGDGAKRCELLKDLVHDFPDSRYVPCASERCSGIAIPKESHAPKTCHPYIEREVSAGPAGR